MCRKNSISNVCTHWDEVRWLAFQYPRPWDTLKKAILAWLLLTVHKYKTFPILYRWMSKCSFNQQIQFTWVWFAASGSNITNTDIHNFRLVRTPMAIIWSSRMLNIHGLPAQIPTIFLIMNFKERDKKQNNTKQNSKWQNHRSIAAQFNKSK